MVFTILGHFFVYCQCETSLCWTFNLMVQSNWVCLFLMLQRMKVSSLFLVNTGDDIVRIQKSLEIYRNISQNALTPFPFYHGCNQNLRIKKVVKTHMPIKICVCFVY